MSLLSTPSGVVYTDLMEWNNVLICCMRVSGMDHAGNELQLHLRLERMAADFPVPFML